MSRKNFLFTTELDLLTPELFFKLCISQGYTCISQGYIQKSERNWKNSIDIRAKNFAKFVNF